MLNSNEIEAVPEKLTKLFRGLQFDIFSDIIERLTLFEDITRTTDWEIDRLYALGASKKEIKKRIKESLKLSDSEISRIFNNILAEDYARYKPIYEELGQAFIPFEQNRQLQQFIKAIEAQTKEEFRNITQSLGFAVKNPDGTKRFTPIAKYYQDVLDRAEMGITSGAFDYNTMIRQAVKELTDNGLRTVDYASGWSNRVDVAARRALLTGFNQVVAKITEDNAEKLGTDYFEITYHIGARPTHQPWQGRVYSRDELVTVCGYGEVDGLKGANCYHDFHPFFKGISKRIYSDEELDRMNARENAPKDYKGKQYTTYEALQRQRRLETTLRAQRQEIRLLEQGHASEDDILAAKARYFRTSSEYAEFSKKMGLPQQRERITADGLGTIRNTPKTSENIPFSSGGNSSETVEKSGESDIIESGSDEVVEYTKLGKLNIRHELTDEFGKFQTDEIIVTDERVDHIKEFHPQDYELFTQYGKETVISPDEVIKDCKHIGTVFMVKNLPDTNLNVIVRLALDSDKPGLKNSVMTFYRIRERNLKKLREKNKPLYKNE